MSENQPITSNLEPVPVAKRFAALILKWNASHPVLAIMLVSLLAVCINCHPIIFCGKSFVSPALFHPLVYDGETPLPGVKAVVQLPNHGSDTAAMMLWGIPAGFVESRALLEDGELPLWNRYGHVGDTFIGQAVTMLGDPLQLIVILGRGTAWAWDIKFLTAKFTFCVGFGMLMLRLFQSRPLALIYAAFAAYCGAFFYINNHPVFFVFCYAPWILLSGLGWLDLQAKHYVTWGLVWLLVNFGCFNGGHVEVSVVLIGGLNLAVVAYELAAYRRMADQVRMLGRMAVGTLLLVGLTAPVWMSFLGALQGSYSVHSDVKVSQLPLSFLPGAFDDLFYQLLFPSDSYAAIAPGASLLVLSGCILSGLHWRQSKKMPFFWINSGAIILWAGCIFKLVPASLIAAIPLLNRVGHTSTDFSYLLIIHLTVQSAYGFVSLANERNFRRAMVDFLWIALVFVGMLLEYDFGTTHRPILWNYFLCVFVGAIGAPLLYTYLRHKNQQVSMIGWMGILLLSLIAQFRFGFYSFGNKDLLMLSGSRAVLNAPSPAVDIIKLDRPDPFRVVGWWFNFCGDYAAVYGLEDIRSCAPLSNRDYIKLVQNFPGMYFGHEWMLAVSDMAAAQPLLNLLNVKYLLANPTYQVPMRADFHVSERSDFLVLENPEVWPRAFFSDQVVAISSNEEFIQHLLQNGKRPFIALTPEEMARQPGLQKLGATGPTTMLAATNYQLLSNSTAFDIHAASAGMVCLTEGQAKDFTALANGEPKQVLTVNRAFKGIYLDQAGDYHIKFTYRPQHWRLACTLFWIAAGGVFVITATSIYGSRRQTKKIGQRPE
jgi:hypothetical protein